MALKDWKKEIAGEGKFYRLYFDKVKNNDEKVEYTIDIIKEKNKYVIHILYDGEILETEKFKTKSHAFTFAKSYMRTH